jgi:hypothetical protein
MAYIKLELTAMLFEDTLEIWNDGDEYPEVTVTLAELFDEYENNLRGGYSFSEAQTYVQATIEALDRGKAQLIQALQEMEDREKHETY